MSRAAELAELHHLAGSLRRCVTSLQHRYGDAPAMRRVLLDTERILGDLELLDADAAELEQLSHPESGTAERTPRTTASSGETWTTRASAGITDADPVWSP